MKTVYDTELKFDDHDCLIGVELKKIWVTWEGIRPGCSSVAIDAVDGDGQRFSGSPENYHDTPEAAMATALVLVKETLESAEARIKDARAQAKSLRRWLHPLPPKPRPVMRRLTVHAQNQRDLRETVDWLAQCFQDFKDSGEAPAHAYYDLGPIMWDRLETREQRSGL